MNKFKVGDRVKRVIESGFSNMNGMKIGDIFTVKSINSNDSFIAKEAPSVSCAISYFDLVKEKQLELEF
jgi:hypothetical protein